jgi:hypothetical protein
LKPLERKGQAFESGHVWYDYLHWGFASKNSGPALIIYCFICVYIIGRFLKYLFVESVTLRKVLGLHKPEEEYAE